MRTYDDQHCFFCGESLAGVPAMGCSVPMGTETGRDGFFHAMAHPNCAAPYVERRPYLSRTGVIIGPKDVDPYAWSEAQRVEGAVDEPPAFQYDPSIRAAQVQEIEDARKEVAQLRYELNRAKQYIDQHSTYWTL